jgi:uncharacterized protein (UPF0335 family)
MESQIENLILEHLKRFQASQERIEREFKEIKGRISQVEISIAGVRGDILRMFRAIRLGIKSVLTNSAKE